MANDVLVTIGTVDFNDFSSDAFYLLTATPELLSSLSTRQTKSAKQGEHGVHDSLSFYNDRLLPFEGEIHATSQEECEEMKRALKAAVAMSTFQNYAGDDGYKLVLITDEDGLEWQCYAKIVEPPVFRVIDNADPTRRSFSFLMSCKDPVLYSQTLEEATGDETVEGTNFFVSEDEDTFQVPFELYQYTTPSLTVTNNGSVGATPLITINGPTEGPTVKNLTSDMFIHLEGLSVLLGETVVIDTLAKTIEKDGVDVSAYMTVDSEWWVLEPGANDIALIDEDGGEVDGVVTLQHRATLI
jgi:hypothetical protein